MKRVRATVDRSAALFRKPFVVVLLALAGAAAAGYLLWTPGPPPGARRPVERATPVPDREEVELTASQVTAIRIEPVGEAAFERRRRAVGAIDFDQNSLVQVFTPWQGRLLAVHVNTGDRVQPGQLLFTVDSPDLLQASAAAIAAAGVLALQNRTLKRLTETLKSGGGAQKDVDQAVSDQQAAEGALRAARAVLRIYGKSESEIDRLIAERRADSTLEVHSPIAGFVTARNAAPGLLVQPGSAPAPLTLAPAGTMWMIANVPEADAPAIRVGQAVSARVGAYPDRTFGGEVGVVGATIDPQTRRFAVRSVIADPDRLLRAGMFADFTIRLGDPLVSLAVPASAVVREGDGSQTVWVTADRRRFEKRTVRTGLAQDGRVQVLEGLSPGTLVVVEGGLFLTNKLVGGPTD
ncbi:MAG: efflux RND transporter periplasmic adaptor subunit [Proteobacteria bacterium]|nr:efflux RND transporter periplasmic adaptor subunit [Pseudomonadota bacterium]